jgi:hypothetical protein
MSTAKDIRVAPVARPAADACIKRHHYSGKVVNNSTLHFGVFLDGVMHGALQFGPSTDKRKIQGLVSETGWNGFIELNRMALGPALPRNSESRAIAIAMRLIRKQYPHIEWVVSFSDGTQCGDGTIYRASGFVLTGIKRNTQVWAAPTGEVFFQLSLKKGGNNHHTGAASMKAYKDAGFAPLPGFQLRYIYFLNPAARARLTVPVLPFSAIDDAGARMYLGTSRPKQATDGSTVERQCNADPDAFTPSQASNDPDQ